MAKFEYRMAVDASVCFSVEANSEAEARAEGYRLLDELEEGVDCPGFESGNGARLYITRDIKDKPKNLSIEDVNEAG